MILFYGLKIFLVVLIEKFIKISRDLFKSYFKKWCIIKDVVEETAEDGKISVEKFLLASVDRLCRKKSLFMDCISDYPKEEWI